MRPRTRAGRARPPRARARVNQADLRRLEQHTADMRALLVAEREQWATRESKAREHAEEVCREVRDAAYEQASVEHCDYMNTVCASELEEFHYTLRQTEVGKDGGGGGRRRRRPSCTPAAPSPAAEAPGARRHR